MTAFWNWIKGLAAGAFASAISFFAGLEYGSVKQKKKIAEGVAKDAKKDLDIAAEPSKRGADLIDGL